MPMQPESTIIITGAAGNLGSAVAHVLAASRTRLILVDRTQEGLAAVAARLPEGTEVLTLPGYDLTDLDAAREMVAQATDRFGGITGLVNTVGGFAMGRVDADALGQWDLMMTLNARVALVTSAAVLPSLAAGRFGRIVHIAAGPGLKSSAGMAAYAASKAAVMRLTESIADEHAKDHITANCVLPGTIAELIGFLVSREGGIVTGAAIPANGLG
jgi:short-subunit dehydrogenase